MHNLRRRLPLNRLAAFLTLLLATALGTYAATASLPSPAPSRSKLSPAFTLPNASSPTQLLISTTPTKHSPVNGHARAADEPPSRPAVSKQTPRIAIPGSSSPTPRKLSSSPATPSRPHTHTLRMEVTAYCPCTLCCGPNAQGLTASGRPVTFNHGRFVAADTSLLPFGTRLVIPGYNHSRPVPVADRGGAIQGRRLDLFFPTHAQAQQWGRQWVTVTILDD